MPVAAQAQWTAEQPLTQQLPSQNRVVALSPPGGSTMLSNQPIRAGFCDTRNGGRCQFVLQKVQIADVGGHFRHFAPQKNSETYRRPITVK
jgi:hypothetical protein